MSCTFICWTRAIAVGICQNLNKKDKIVTAHRSHAHYLAKGGSLKMIAELHGKVTGCAKGFGGSMHLIDLNSGRSCSNSWKHNSYRRRYSLGK